MKEAGVGGIKVVTEIIPMILRLILTVELD